MKEVTITLKKMDLAMMVDTLTFCAANTRVSQAPSYNYRLQCIKNDIIEQAKKQGCNNL